MVNEVDVPRDIRNLRVQDLNSINKDDELLTGLWETLPKSIKLNEEWMNVLHHNQERVLRIRNQMEELESLRSKINTLQTEEKQAAQEWYAIEPQMHSKIQPYSRVGIARMIQRDLEDPLIAVKNIESKMLDPELKPEDALVLAKRFVQAKQQIYFNQRLVEEI